MKVKVVGCGCLISFFATEAPELVRFISLDGCSTQHTTSHHCHCGLEEKVTQTCPAEADDKSAACDCEFDEKEMTLG